MGPSVISQTRRGPNLPDMAGASAKTSCFEDSIYVPGREQSVSNCAFTQFYFRTIDSHNQVFRIPGRGCEARSEAIVSNGINTLHTTYQPAHSTRQDRRCSTN